MFVFEKGGEKGYYIGFCQMSMATELKEYDRDQIHVHASILLGLLSNSVKAENYVRRK
jgi:hypothetical protein